MRDWSVSTIAGCCHWGYVDGVGSIARFHFPRGIAMVADNRSLLVADSWNSRIREICLISHDEVMATLREVDAIMMLPPGILPIILSYFFSL